MPSLSNGNNANKGYSTIPSIHSPTVATSDPEWSRSTYLAPHGRNRILLACTISAFLSLTILLALNEKQNSQYNSAILSKSTASPTTLTSTTTTTSSIHLGQDDTTTLIVVPYGINLASWLSLEDYFFVGRDGALEVATGSGQSAARCFPPLWLGSNNKNSNNNNDNNNTFSTWYSETDLLDRLAQQYSVREAILAFQAYRTAFIDLEDDLARIAAYGIQAVRVPISWCLTDFDPTQDHEWLGSAHDSTPSNTTSDQILWERYTCLDPFFAQQGQTVRWPAVPKMLLQRFLRACHRHGLKAVLDIHTYAGGTSIGTFSGVWPSGSIFWQYDQPEYPESDFARNVYKDFLLWIESLADTDPDAFAGLKGITPMNEPGHLAGIFGPGSSQPDKPSFVPMLPTELGISYLQDDLNNVIPDGPHLRVLKWQSDAVETFRQTSLPQRGIQVVINVHESIFVGAITVGDEDDSAGRHPVATKLIAQWWKQVTSTNERAHWAVLDMHHYHAWESQCQGTVTGQDGRYLCGDVDVASHVLQACSSWVQVFRDALDEPTARLSSGEFSASTHHSVLESCLDTTTLGLSYMAQTRAGQTADVDLYFWTWKMPYGGAFRYAWSWQALMHRLHGPTTRSSSTLSLPLPPPPPMDESVLACGV